MIMYAYQQVVQNILVLKYRILKGEFEVDVESLKEG